ncbi:MAG TPA: M12 family metallo-peptidase, partial [Thermoanaerobaculia bacterium]|nr:M12 family metallo-peptidase [Thermoanaerobaculia bacterium]
MRRTVAAGLFPGVVFLSLAFAASGATIPSPYRPTASPDTAARFAAEGQEGLDLDVRALAALRDGSDSVVEIEAFPVAPGENARLRLSRFEVMAPDAKIIIEGKNGRTTMSPPPVKDFRGTIEGEPDATVYLGVASDMVVAWVHSRRGHVYVGPNEAKSGFVVRNANSPLNAAATSVNWKCDQENLPQHIALAAPSSAPAPAAAPMIAGYKQAMVDVETDNQLYVFFGNDAGTTPGLIATYVHTLYGADNVIYDRDLAMHLTVQSIHLWAVADPYVGPDTASQLMQLGDWWHTNMPLASHPRTLVHYLSGHPVTGGIGWVGVLCTPDFAVGSDWGGAYSLTQVFGTYPLQIWDIDATSHEQGHNSGSVHTHCMGPPESYPDWTDECYSGEGTGCYSGPTSVPPGLGTIMSYCHLIPPGYFDNINLVFHSRCINDYMLPEIAGASCLASPATFGDVPTTNPF